MATPRGQFVYVTNTADFPSGGGGGSGGLTDTQLRASAVPVSNATLPLPTGAATGTKQDTGNTSLGSIDTKLTSQATAAKQDTGNTSLASVDTKLTSQATAAKQDTGNTSLSSIDTKLSSQATATKQDTGNTSVASVDTNIGAKADSAATTDTGTFSVIAFIKRSLQNWTTLLAKTWGLAAGENFIGVAGGVSALASANFNRPGDTTPYASGDLVANSTTAGSVTPMSLTVARINDGTGMLRRVRLKTSSTSVTSASFRVHFYSASPTVTNGDNGAWLSTESSYIGAADVTVDKAFSDAAKGTGSPNTGSEMNFTASTGAKTIFALLEARAAYTPTNAETFTLSVEVLQN